MIFSLAILASGLSASLVSMHSVYWFLPLIISIVPVIGLLTEKTPVISAGIFTTIFFYFFVNRELPLRVANILLILGILFIFFGLWFFARYLLLLRTIEENSRKGSQNTDLISYSRSARNFTVYGIFTNILLGAFLSIIASLMGSYSSLGRITTGRIEVILMIVFTFSLFFVIYKMISLMKSEE